MFRVVVIKSLTDTTFKEDSFLVEEAFFFTIKTSSYYTVFNNEKEVIGIIPIDYNLFFKVDDNNTFEDIDMENILRLFDANIPFYIVGTTSNSHKISLISSETISEFKLIENDFIKIPFTNKAFDSDGIVVFKNMSSLVESICREDLY